MIGELFSAAAIGIAANGGPCTAARVIAGSACFRGSRRFVAISAFTCGAIATDVALVSSLGLFFRALQFSGWWYALAAASTLLAFFWTITRPPADRCAGSHGLKSSRSDAGLALPLLAGIGSALLLGACCAPFVFAAAATGVAVANPLPVAMVYGVAHAAVPLTATLLSGRVLPTNCAPVMREATIAIQSGMLLGCAIYFGFLA